jgi:hypothetical protein
MPWENVPGLVMNPVRVSLTASNAYSRIRFFRSCGIQTEEPVRV